MSAMRNLVGKVAIVTGGTFGVGRGIASVLGENGARVFVTGRSADDVVAAARLHISDATTGSITTWRQRSTAWSKRPAQSTFWSTTSGAATSGWSKTGIHMD